MTPILQKMPFIIMSLSDEARSNPEIGRLAWHFNPWTVCWLQPSLALNQEWLDSEFLQIPGVENRVIDGFRMLRRSDSLLRMTITRYPELTRALCDFLPADVLQ